MAKSAEGHIDRNYDAFVAALPGILALKSGQFALIHDCEIVDFYSNPLEAIDVGAEKFGLGKFSVQEVRSEPEHLGFYSYVGGSGPY
jgi:hypothetical protein